MEKGKLFFVCGLARSGKSTFCDHWVRTGDLLPPRKDELDVFDVWVVERPRAIVCGDDFRTALHGGQFTINAEGTVFAMMDVAARALLNRGFDVIIDETCTTEATLLRYLRIDPWATPIFIDTPAEVCVERARQAGKEYLVGPIQRMAAQLTTLRQNWDETIERLKAYLRERAQHDVTC